MNEDRVRARFRGYDAPEEEVEQTSFVGMTAPALDPAPRPVAPARAVLTPPPPPSAPPPLPTVSHAPVAEEPAPVEEVRADVTPFVRPPSRQEQLWQLARVHGRKAAAAGAVLLLVVGVPYGIHRHRVGVHEAKVATVTGLLEEAGRVQSIVHTYEGSYGNELQLVDYGFALPANGFDVAEADRFDFCMTARLDEVVLTLRDGEAVGTRPC